MLPDLTITIPGWLPTAYLAIGVLVWLPLQWHAFRSVARHAHPDEGHAFWPYLWRGVREGPWLPVLAVVLWPWALWGELSP